MQSDLMPLVPIWLKNKGKTFTKTLSLVNRTVKKSGIATVCEEASCPNRTECWSSGTATFMLMGEQCTRACRFCAVKTSNSPGELNPLEAENLVKAISQMSNPLHIVLTSVNRDDLIDGGASHFAECIQLLSNNFPKIGIEVLIPDFKGDVHSLQTILDSKPKVVAHNIETVERLQKKVRDKLASYSQSIFVLKQLKRMSPRIFTKSSIMLGLGESKEEVIQTMKDLREVDVDFLTLGQYMRPSFKHLTVKEYVKPAEFDKYESIGLEMGFKYVASGPLVRSSYKAGVYFQKKIGIENVPNGK